MSKISQIDRNFQVPEYVEKEDLCYYDVKNAPFVVCGVFYEDGRFRRLPEKVAKSVSEGVLYLHGNTSGGRIRFMTDSSYVAIHAELDKVEPMPHMPLYCDVKSVLVGLQNTAQVEKAKPYEKTVVYYGHSITQGDCASRPGNSYPNILTRRLNADHINLGFSGNCKGEPQLAEYIASLPMQALVMDYDHNAPTKEHLQATHEPFFRIIREKHPNLPVIFLTSTAQARFFDDQEGRKEVIRRTYENTLDTGDQKVYFIDGSRIYDGCGAATVEGCHANDLGFWLQVGAVESVLKNVL